MKNPLLFLAPLALISLNTAMPALAGEASSNAWINYRGRQQNCVREAKQALESTGYTGVTIVSETIYGDDGPYSAVVRCVASKEIVFFFTYGPEVTVTTKSNERLVDVFKQFAR
jgi:hypothetical protein